MGIRAGAEFGAWAMTPKSRSAGNWSKLAGLPTNRILALKATDRGLTVLRGP